jgi:hypothetical protein
MRSRGMGVDGGEGGIGGIGVLEFDSRELWWFYDR